MSALRGAVNRLIWHARTRSAVVATGSLAALGLVALALAERIRVQWRRARGKRPRLLWGPSPVLSIKHWSAAMRALGYESTTFVRAGVGIAAPEDFDAYWADVIAGTRTPRRWHPYVPFAWALRRGDVHLTFFDGGYLRGTPFEAHEHLFLRIAGKQLVVAPYGSDIAAVGHLGHIEAPLLADYPDLPSFAEAIKRRVLYLSEFAGANILTLQPGFQPVYDVLWGNQLCVDAPPPGGAPADRDDGSHNGAVTVVHAPNHRAIKGTAHLEQAVEELRGEGVNVTLEVMEGQPNAEVRAAIAEADIVADQFLFGYGMFATEGLAAGKPVLSNLDHLPDVFRSSPQMQTCPIVSTNPSNLKEVLRRLIEDPDLRRRVGDESSAFFARFHSYEAVAGIWDSIIRFAWEGTPLPDGLAAPRDPSAHPSGASVKRSCAE